MSWQYPYHTTVTTEDLETVTAFAGLSPIPVPAIDLRPDLRKILDACDLELKEMLYWTERFSSIFDIDVCDVQYIDHILRGLGYPFFPIIPLTDNQKRKIAKLLTKIYSLKGTAAGLVLVAKLLLNIDLFVAPAYDPGNDSGLWILSVSLLDFNTYLGIGTGSLYEDLFYHFHVVLVNPQVLTSHQLTNLNFIVQYIKPAHTHYDIMSLTDWLISIGSTTSSSSTTTSSTTSSSSTL